MPRIYKKFLTGAGIAAAVGAAAYAGISTYYFKKSAKWELCLLKVPLTNTNGKAVTNSAQMTIPQFLQKTERSEF